MRDLSNDVVVQKSKNGVNYLQFRVLNELGVKHAYSLKPGGLNFNHSGDFSLEKKSYKSLCDVVGVDFERVCRPDQKHTDKVRVINNVYSTEIIGEYDGLATDKSDLVLASTNADCILYLIYDKKKKVIANVHSGWRGSYQRITENMFDLMVNEYGCDLNDLIVCSCPSIRRCCFEVGEDVKEMFYEKFSFLESINKFIVNGYEDGKFFVDTIGINKELFKLKGIREENIYDSGICSVCNSDLVHSYRSEGKDFVRASGIISL